MSENNEPRTPVLLLCTALAANFLYVDWVKGVRSNFWIGLAPADMLAAVLAFAAYLIVLLGLFSPWIVLRRKMRVQGKGVLLDLLALGAASFVLWAVLGLLSEGLSNKRAIMLGCISIIPLILAAGAAYLNLSLRRFIVLMWLVPLIAGMSAASASGYTHFLDQARASATSNDAVAWTIISGNILLGFVGLQRKRQKLALWTIGGTVLLILLPWGLLLEPPPQQKPNAGPSFVLITCDALRADYMSTYGGPAATPAVEDLAKRGILFERAYTLAPWTHASVHGLYFSTYPPSLSPGAGMDQWRKEITAYDLRGEQLPLAARLAQKGYSSALMTGNGLVGRKRATTEGFDYILRLGHQEPGRTGFWRAVPYFQETLSRASWRLADHRPVDTTAVLTNYAMRFLNAHAGESVFLWLHYMDPHSPYDPPGAFRTGTTPWEVFDPHNDYWGTPQHDPCARLPLTDAGQASVQDMYIGEIEYVSQAIGQVMDVANALDEAYIVLTADHGEELWDHGRWGHGHSLYDEVTRVPLLVAGPGIAPRVISEPVSLIDIVPTMAEALDAGVDEGWKGRSLLDVLSAGNTDDLARPVFVQATNLLSCEEPLQAMVLGDYKLIRALKTGAIELYDLENDPGERENLAASDPDRARELLAVMEAWTASWPSDFSRQQTGEPAELDPAIQKELEALGYVD
ncbi:MAG: sulfatase [Candidatus Hydrogenedentes bacterium]|nr:sulfatase [Candidatus Hydrogenedentota bacterium]